MSPAEPLPDRPLRGAALASLPPVSLSDTPALDLAWLRILDTPPPDRDTCDELDIPFSDLPMCV